MNDLIGFFDSGVGGVSVLHVAQKVLPNEHYLFYGDNQNAPYGTKSLAEIRDLSRRGIDHLLARDVKAVVIACNTATSAYAEILRSEVSIPVIAMEPAIKPAQEARSHGDILALATRATLSLPKFRRLMGLYGDNVIPVVGEGFVELVENGLCGTPEADQVLRGVLSPYMDRTIDAIVLGCTHYPFLAPEIQALFPGARIFDGRLGTVLQLKRRLEAEHLLTGDTRGSITLESSGGEAVCRLMERLMRQLDDINPDA